MKTIHCLCTRSSSSLARSFYSNNSEWCWPSPSIKFEYWMAFETGPKQIQQTFFIFNTKITNEFRIERIFTISFSSSLPYSTLSLYELDFSYERGREIVPSFGYCMYVKCCCCHSNDSKMRNINKGNTLAHNQERILFEILLNEKYDYTNKWNPKLWDFHSIFGCKMLNKIDSFFFGFSWVLGIESLVCCLPFRTSILRHS